MLSTCERVFVVALQGAGQPSHSSISAAWLAFRLIEFLRLPLALIGADEVLHRSLKSRDNRFGFADFLPVRGHGLPTACVLWG